MLDGMKVKKVVDEFAKLTHDEQQVFFAIVALLNEMKAKTDAQQDSARADPRGRYSCPVCHKVLPTKRGRSIHLSHHAAIERSGRVPPKETP